MGRTRSRAVKLNVISSVANELAVLVFGLIVPRIVLTYFGSTYNGLLNSIVQFMSFSVVLRSGLGVVTSAALYGPLAQGDMQAVSGIMVATDKFMQKIGWLLAGIIVAFSLIYPLMVQDEFEYLFSASLILIIGAASWAENMFSVKYKVLLQADQKTYIQTFAAAIAYILSNAIAILLMVTGCRSIHMVRLGMVMGLLTTPLMLKKYVDRHYAIDWNQPANNMAVKSRWDAFAQQIATIANNNISTIVMTFLFPLKELSVYTVYHMVVKNISQLIGAGVVGIRAAFGDMYAKGEHDRLKKRFRDVEWLVIAGSAALYGITAIMLTPFVLIYTSGVTDANYNRYWFGLLMTASCYIYTTRLPYQMIAEAVGCFKETRNSAIIEVVLNIAVSVACAPFMGLNGIVMGTLAGSLIRTGNLIWVCNRSVLHVSLWQTLKNYAVYLTVSCILVLIISWLIGIDCENLKSWVATAIPVTLAVSIVILGVSLVFNHKEVMGVLSQFLRRKNLQR